MFVAMLVLAVLALVVPFVIWRVQENRTKTALETQRRYFVADLKKTLPRVLEDWHQKRTGEPPTPQLVKDFETAAETIIERANKMDWVKKSSFWRRYHSGTSLFKDIANGIIDRNKKGKDT